MDAAFRGRPPAGPVALEWTILGLVTLSVCAAFVLFGGVRLWSIGPLAGLVAVAGVLFFLRTLLFRETGPLGSPPLMPVLLAVLGWLLIHAVTFSRVPQESQLQLLLIGVGVLAYWIMTELSAVHARWRIVLGIVLVFISAEAWYAIIQHTRGMAYIYHLPRPSGYGLRASGTWFCPNHFAHMMEIGVLAGLALLWLRGVGLALRLVAVHTVMLAGYALVLSQSRSGLLGLLAGLVVMGLLFALRRGVRWFLAGLLVVPSVVGGIAWVGWQHLDTIRERFIKGLNDGGAGRLDMWRGTLKMIRDAPWLGTGGGTFRHVEPAYQVYDGRLSAVYAHNEVLHFAAEYGAIGAVLIVVFFIAFAAVLLLRIRRTSSETSAHLFIGCLGVMTATLVHAQFDYILHLYANTMVLAVILGLAAARLGGWDAGRVRRSARRERAEERADSVDEALVASREEGCP